MSDELKFISEWLGAGSINLFGRPFSGKDTQAKRLAELLGGSVIGGGQILRSHHDPAAVEKTLIHGELAPSDFYKLTVLPYLSRSEYKDRPLMLSAVGRAHGEEIPVITAADAAGHPIKAVINLEFPEPEVWRRFEAAKVHGDRGPRQDDSREALQTRLAKFRQQTVPVIGFYRDKGLLIEVDGTPPPDIVTQEIVSRLAGLAKRSAA